MISVDNIRLEYNGIPLFDDISFLIQSKERVGLVGNNGSGKTSLLKIIRGDIHPDEGQVRLPSDLQIGYLPQHIELTDHNEVFNAVYYSQESIVSVERSIEEIMTQISERSDYNSLEYLRLSDQLNELSQKYQMLGGDNLEADIKRTLKGLGFREEDMEVPLSKFSGGWRMRVELAKILIKRPDVLLLDEPTNHLDIESIRWFENYLQQFQGAVIIISHDRAFLDNITTRTIEINWGRLYDYKVPYSKFVKEKEKRLAMQQAAYENQQKKIKETEEFIERFRYKANKASLVQSRIKQLEKMKEVEVEQQDASRISIQFPDAPRSAREVVSCKHVFKAYGPKRVLDDVNLLVERQERVAFVGKNGEGKTTLAKIIAGQINYEGEVIIGDKVEVGYFAQNQDELLDENKTVLQTMEVLADDEQRKRLRSLLGSFLFQGEDVDKKVEVLSGGERSRLALATLLLRPYNLLILDEPTNHLDMRSKEVLKQALQNYNGTLVVVSHDRDFMDGLVEKVYEFKDQQIHENIGGIYEFLEKKDLQELDDLNIGNTAGNDDSGKRQQKKSGKKEFEQWKHHKKQLRKIERDIQETEKHIDHLEKEINTLTDKMNDPQNQMGEEEYNEYAHLNDQYNEAMQKWEDLYHEWKKISK